MKKVMFSSFNFNLELILEDKFHMNILDTAVYMNVSGRERKISSKLKLKEENITFFIEENIA